MSDAAISTAPATQARTESGGFWSQLWRQFRKHPGGVAGLVVFTFIVLAVFIGPYIHTIDPNKIDIRAKNQGPSWAHPFGTDNLGKDMLAQVLAGGRSRSPSAWPPCCWRSWSARWWGCFRAIRASSTAR